MNMQFIAQLQNVAGGNMSKRLQGVHFYFWHGSCI